MATRMLTSKCRIVAYLPNLSAAVRHFTAFNITSDKGSYSSLPPTTKPAEHLNECFSKCVPSETVINRIPFNIDIIGNNPLVVDDSDGTKCDLSVLQQFIDSDEASVKLKPTSVDLLECVAQDCSKILHRNFQDLFPDRNLNEGNLTVITLSQKTENDMSGWNPTVEAEREILLENFVNGAKEICNALWSVGYWADFIDPSSGSPFYGSHTNSTLFETDECYKKLGFDIEDLGCCKVISHHLWGTHAYVGSLFTNASIEYPMIQQITQNI